MSFNKNLDTEDTNNKESMVEGSKKMHNEKKTKLPPSPLEKTPAIDKSKKIKHVDFATDIKILFDNDLTENAKLKKINEDKKEPIIPFLKKYGLVDDSNKPHPMLHKSYEEDKVQKGKNIEVWEKARDEDLLLKHTLSGIVLLNYHPVIRLLCASAMKLDAFNDYFYATFFHTMTSFNPEDLEKMVSDIEEFCEKNPEPTKDDFIKVFNQRAKNIDNHIEQREKYFDTALSYGAAFIKFWQYFCPVKAQFNTYKFIKFAESNKPFNLETSKEFFNPELILPQNNKKYNDAINYITNKSYIDDPKNGINLENACYQVAYGLQQIGYQVQSKGTVSADNTLTWHAGSGLHDLQIIGKDLAVLVETTAITGKNQLGAEQNILDHMFKTKFYKPTYMIFVAPEFLPNTKLMLQAAFKEKKSRNENKYCENIIFMTCDDYATFLDNEIHRKNSLNDERFKALLDGFSVREETKFKRKLI